jgi:uracil-DNA glycosylase family 4
MGDRPDCIAPDVCPLWNDAYSPYIPASGSKRPDLLVIGDMPGADEDSQNQPFVGEESNLLRDLLKQVGFNMDKVAFTYAVKCRITQVKWGKTINREATAGELNRCKVHAMAEIEVLKPRLVLLLGALTLKAYLGETGIISKRGRFFDKDGVTYLAAVSPAFVAKDMTHLDTFCKDIESAYKWLYAEREEKLPTSYTLINNKAGLIDLVARANDAEIISFDLETSHLSPFHKDSQIVCCALSFQELESFVVPLYHKNMIFTGKDLNSAKAVIEAVMGSPVPKVAQNGKFDIKWLQVTEAIETVNFAYDTMLMAFMVNEQSGTHALDYLAWKYTDMGGYDEPLNEYKRSHKEADPSRGGSYRNIPWDVLYPYAGMDTDCTLRCFHKMKEELDADMQLVRG